MKKLLFILVIFPFASYSQETGYNPGYIITNRNDTIKGLVKNRNDFPYKMLVNLKYKADEKGKEIEISPDSLAGFTLNGTRYLSMYLPEKKEKFFFQVRVEGYLSFYELEYKKWPQRGTSYFVILRKHNPDQELSFEIDNILFPFKKKMREFLSDAPDLGNKIRNGKYNQYQIKGIVSEYNSLHPDK